MMTKVIALLATDGVEEVELIKPWKKLQKCGYEAILVSLTKSKIQSMKGDIAPQKKYKPNMTIDDAIRHHFDGIVLPGGTVNADTLRGSKSAITFVQKFVKKKAPIAVICHGSWILIEAKGVASRSLTSWPTLRTDLQNAGARWRDEALVEDGNLISSRSPDDLKVFCDGIVKQYRKQPLGQAQTRGRSIRPVKRLASAKKAPSSASGQKRAST